MPPTLLLNSPVFVLVDRYGEELARSQEEVRRLQGSLAGARDECVGVSEERLQLQQENLQLRREMDEQRKANLLVQKRAKQQVHSGGAGGRGGRWMSTGGHRPVWVY